MTASCALFCRRTSLQMHSVWQGLQPEERSAGPHGQTHWQEALQVRGVQHPLHPEEQHEAPHEEISWPRWAAHTCGTFLSASWLDRPCDLLKNRAVHFHFCACTSHKHTPPGCQTLISQSRKPTMTICSIDTVSEVFSLISAGACVTSEVTISSWQPYLRLGLIFYNRSPFKYSNITHLSVWEC